MRAAAVFLMLLAAASVVVYMIDNWATLAAAVLAFVDLLRS